MKSVPANDRPKMIAVVIGIVIAVGFLARSLMGTQTLAQPQQAETVASSASAAPEIAAANRSARDQAAATAAPADPAVATSEADAAMPADLPDPFHPITSPAAAKVAVAAVPAPSAPASTDSGRIVPAVAVVPPAPPVPVLAACAPPAPADSQPMPIARQSPPVAATPISQAAEKSAADIAAARDSDASLVGTVGEGNDAVAVFRGSEKAAYLHSRDVIARWRVANIQIGRVGLSHNEQYREIHPGDKLPGLP